jgi:hypothetical protein
VKKTFAYPAPIPGWERWAVRLILAVFAVVAFNGIRNGLSQGQDFSIHVTNTRRLMYDPDKWFTADATNRPLLYWIGEECLKFTNDRYTYQLASMIFCGAGALALGLLHDAMRRLVGSPVLRVAALALLAFLPVTIVTTVVYAADTVVLLPFALGGWGVMRCLEEDSNGRAAGFAALAGLAFTLGNFSKATFLVVPVGVGFALVALWRAGRLKAARGWTVLALAVILPGLTGGWIAAKAARETAGEPARHTFNWHGTGELTFRSLLGVKVSDRRIFDAPEYLVTEMRDGSPVYPLLVENNYSYPALLHLSVFTDVLNFAHAAVTPRPEPQHRAAQWSVRLGIIFSLGALITVLVFWGQTLRALVRPQSMPSSTALLWSGMAMAWYAPVVINLPFVYHVYAMGYWLPRLVLPALWIFLASFFVAVDRLPEKWRGRAGALMLSLVLILSAVEIRSLWY